MRRSGLLVLTCLLSLWLSGCGEGASDPTVQDSPAAADTSQAAAPDGPDCAEVWVDRHALPDDYRGCVDSGTWVRADARRCASGQVIVVYADRYYGAKGAVVNDMGGSLDQSRQFQRALRSCGG